MGGQVVDYGSLDSISIGSLIICDMDPVTNSNILELRSDSKSCCQPSLRHESSSHYCRVLLFRNP